MKPLREETSSPDPAIARAATLLSAMRRLDLAPPSRRAPAAVAPSRPKALTLRVALVLAATLASAAAGAATLRGTGWLHSVRSFLAHPAAAPTPTTPAVARGGPSHVEALAEPAIGSEVLSPAAPSPAATFGATRASAPARAYPPRETARTAPTPSVEESALVLDAVRALRRDHDPKRARELAQQAMLRFPQGAQVEEAMAVAMEAAFVEGDAEGARLSANRYLERFAAGRFADRARHILADSLR